jgi:hypothetical protein
MFLVLRIEYNLVDYFGNALTSNYCITETTSHQTAYDQRVMKAESGDGCNGAVEVGFRH